MSAGIDPAFADRCAATAIGLRQLAELGARPDADEGAVELAAAVTAELLTDPEALLAVALVIEQQRAGAGETGRASFLAGYDAGWDAPSEGDPGWYERARAEALAVHLTQPGAGEQQPRPRPAPPRDDDLRTLRPGRTRLVGGKMWARCKNCNVIGPLDGPGSWHVCDPVDENRAVTR